MRVEATWFVKRLPENINDIHVSFGFGDEQWDGFFVDDEGSCLTITNENKLYRIHYTCLVDEDTLAHIKECEAAEDYDPENGLWISPNVWEEMDAEDEHRTDYSIE